MSACEIYICDGCAAEQREEIGDGPPLGWAQNVEEDDFCPKCAKLLDPYDPELDEAAR